MAGQLVLVGQSNSCISMADIKAVGHGPVLCHTKHCPRTQDVGKKNQRIRWAEGCLHFFQRLSHDVLVRSIMICCQSSFAHDHVCYVTAVWFLLLCLEKMLCLFIFFFLSQSCSVIICCKGVRGRSLCLSIQGSYIELLNLTVKRT